jgi:hypothetical protein
VQSLLKGKTKRVHIYLSAHILTKLQTKTHNLEMAPSNSFSNQESHMRKPNIHKAFRKNNSAKKLIKHLWKSDLQVNCNNISFLRCLSVAAAAVADALYVHNTYRSAKQKRFYYYDLVCNIFVPRKTEVNLWKCHFVFCDYSNQARKARIMMILLLIMLICILSVTNNLCNIVCVRRSRRRRRIWI